MNERVRFVFMRVVPKRALSRLVGRFAHTSASRAAIKPFAKRYAIDLTEAERSIEQYGNLCDFFSRRLKAGLRPIDPANESVVSPVDGTVSEMGIIRSGTLIQAKGVHFCVDQLLGGRSDLAEQYEGGWFVTVYLSPADYHRIHMPIEGDVIRSMYVPGTLFPVNLFGVRNVPGLFAKNERLISFIRSEQGSVALVKVGSTIVGSVKVVYDHKLGTNLRRPKMRTVEMQGTRLLKGAELGRFEFGSTIILLFERGMVDENSAVSFGTKVRMGERLVTLVKQQV